MKSESKRESRAERQARTRTELLATAARVFARRGYAGASVEEIAEEAGYSHGAVYSNFAGKADLFLAVLEEYMAERARELAATQIGLDEDEPIEARARALADQWMERFAKDRESFLLHMEFIAHAGRDPELAERFGSRSAALREAIAGYIGHYQEQEGIEPALPPADLALVLRALGIGLAVEALVSPDAVREDLYGDFVELLVGLLRERGSSGASSPTLLRDASPRDAVAAAELWTRAYVDEGEGGRTAPYSEADALETFDRGQVFVAEQRGKVVGVVALFAPGSPGRAVAGADEAELSRLAVAAPARGHRIGRALVAHCSEQAAAAGWSAIALWSRPYQGAAHRLYEALGYRRVAERDSIDESGHGRLVFRLAL